MAEIKVSYSELQEKNIDLEKLLSSELASKVIVNYLSASQGKFVRASKETCTSKTDELTLAFLQLVKNTMTFLNAAGVVFEDADQNASSRVNVITDRFSTTEGQKHG